MRRDASALRASLAFVGVRQRVLTDAERRKLEATLAGIDKAEEAFAKYVRSLGKAGVPAVARELGLTPQGLDRRLRRIEGR